MSTNKRFDAVVIGASLGGLTSAALLASRGYRVALIDKLEQPGGRSGSVEYDGYHIAFGHRDGQGVGDNVFGLPLHFVAAARAAGAELHTRPLAGGMRLHRLPDRTSDDLHLGGRPDMDPLEDARDTVRVLTGHEDVSDETAREYLATLERIRTISGKEQWSLVPVMLGDWLDYNVADEVVRSAILQVGEVMFPSPAERTSVGRLAGCLEQSHAYGARGFYPEDPDADGMQGVASPWLRVIERNGGELWFGWKPLEIVIEDRCVTGVVAVNPAKPRAGVLHARRRHGLPGLGAARHRRERPAALGIRRRRPEDVRPLQRLRGLVGGAQPSANAPLRWTDRGHAGLAPRPVGQSDRQALPRGLSVPVVPLGEGRAGGKASARGHHLTLG